MLIHLGRHSRYDAALGSYQGTVPNLLNEHRYELFRPNEMGEFMNAGEYSPHEVDFLPSCSGAVRSGPTVRSKGSAEMSQL